MTDCIKDLIECFDQLFRKDETCSAYEANETFEKFVRPPSMSISDYIIQFELLYTKAKSHNMEILDGVLAYHLLNHANLSEHHKQLVRATVTHMKYSVMEDQLRKVFANTARISHTKEEPPVKLEPCGSFCTQNSNCQRVKPESTLVSDRTEESEAY